jgi:hypothetical protein
MHHWRRRKSVNGVNPSPIASMWQSRRELWYRDEEETLGESRTIASSCESARLFAGAARLAIALLAIATISCSDDKVTLGAQCPSPRSEDASVEGDAGAGPSAIYGTSCAPCIAGRARVDARGCPMFVTFESCGGDICLGGQRVSRAADADAGSDGDAGAAEDAGGL